MTMNQIKYMVFLLIATVSIPVVVLAETGEEMTKLLGVQLGKNTTLRDVEKRLGKGPIIETGDAGEYKATICYFVPKCQTKVEFWSDELGGHEHELIGFTLTRTHDNASTWRSLDINCADLQLASGIRLGMQQDEFKKTLGGGIKTAEGFSHKAFESRKPMTEKERRKISESLSSPVEAGLIWDIIVFIRGAFSHGGLDVLEVSRTQTF